MKIKPLILTDGLPQHEHKEGKEQGQENEKGCGSEVGGSAGGNGDIKLSFAPGTASTGQLLSPAEWHARLMEMRELQEQGAGTEAGGPTTQLPIVLDCRNTYESDMGRFRGAVPLETDTFADSWCA